MLVRGSQPSAFGTSYFSAVVFFIGYAGQFGWKYGMSVFRVGIGNAVIGSLLAWWVLGPRTREMTQRLKAHDHCRNSSGKRYNSRASRRIAAAAIIFVFLIPYTASVYNGLSRLFGMAFGLPYEWCVIGMAVVTCIYVVLGGYVASVWNASIQGTIMLIGIIAAIFAVLNGQGGNRNGYRKSLADPGRGKRHGRTVHFDVRSLMRSTCLGVIILTSLGTWALPADGPEVLRHQDRSGHQAGRHHLDDLRARGCGWLVFLGWFRPLVRWRYRRRR